MTFLYPFIRQFPVDEPCEQIVRELKIRNWEFPDISIEFCAYGTHEMVQSIHSRDFKLEFGRKQRMLPGNRWIDAAAINKIVIPEKEIRVYNDESGPTFYLYVGGNYEKDRDAFMNGSRANSKLYGEPRTYLQYKGECHCMANSTDRIARLPHTHKGQRPPLLVHTNDLGREYDLIGEEPKEFKTADILEEFRQYLTDVVLKMITLHPLPTEKADVPTFPTTAS